MTASMAAAHANGLALDEQDPISLSTVLAGRAAHASDPNTAFYNPAGMIRLTEPVMAASLTYGRLESRFRNQGSRLGASALTGGDGGRGIGSIWIGSFHAVAPVGDRVRAGLAVTMPYGAGGEPDENWVGRYHLQRSEITTVNINPSLAFRVGDGLSLGVGASAQRLDVELIQAIDMGSLLGFPQQVDGRQRLAGEDWSYGYNLGLLYEASRDLRFGLAYRSPIRHSVDARAEFAVPAAAGALTAAGLFRDTAARSTITLPETVSAGVHIALHPRWALLGDVTYTGWRRLRAIEISYANPSQPAVSQSLAWHDTYRVGVGVVHDLTQRWTLRAGLAHDPSPAANSFQRPGLAFGDRVLAGIGASYRPAPSIGLDVGYMRSFSRDVSVDLAQPASAGRLVGTYELGGDLFAARAMFRF